VSRVPELVRGRIVPLFPLPNVWLFPNVVLPLHIFEERYRQMIEDSLDGPGHLVLGTIQSGREREAPGAPPIHPVAGLGVIERHERLADGRFNILLVGLTRVFVREVPSERLYRLVEAVPVLEVPIAKEREPDLRAELLAALAARTKDLPAIPDELATAHVADMLVLRLSLAHERLNQLYAELDVEKRARAALVEHVLRELEP